MVIAKPHPLLDETIRFYTYAHYCAGRNPFLPLSEMGNPSAVPAMRGLWMGYKFRMPGEAPDQSAVATYTQTYRMRWFHLIKRAVS